MYLFHRRYNKALYKNWSRTSIFAWAALTKEKFIVIKHPFEPLYDENSRILILGSFPSVKSREQMFFYGHPQNRFWRVLAGVFCNEIPVSIEEKKEFLHKNHVALWDTIASCEISGSSDSSIRQVTANDISVILKNADIKRIFTNGKTSGKYYDKYIKPSTGADALTLPSTSPANAAWSLERLIEAWRVILL